MLESEEYQQYRAQRTIKKVELRVEIDRLMAQLRRICVAQGWTIVTYRRKSMSMLLYGTPSQKEAAKAASKLRMQIARLNDRFHAWDKDALLSLCAKGDESALAEWEERYDYPAADELPVG